MNDHQIGNVSLHSSTNRTRLAGTGTRLAGTVHFSSSSFLKLREAELMQYLSPVSSCGPSSNTCPRWAPHCAHTTSTRFIPKLSSTTRWTLPFSATSENDGQPEPLSNFLSVLKRAVPHTTQAKVPSSFRFTCLPVHARSVPASQYITCLVTSRVSH